MNIAKERLRLYAVTDRKWLGSKSLANQVEEAILGGVTIVQLREKNVTNREFLRIAKEVKNITDQYQIPFIINDNIEVALEVSADGVHVGQEDMAVKKVRELIGEEKILGVSVQTVEQAIFAEKEGADYLGVGAVFPTDTKTDAIDVTYESLKEIVMSVKIPVVAIGGIHSGNVLKLEGSKIAGIAVISAIFAQDHIVKASKELRVLMDSIT